MQLHSAVETLSELLRASADDSVRVTEISAEADSSHTRTDLTLAVPFKAGVAAEEVTITDCAYADGTIQLDVSLAVDSNDANQPEPASPESEQVTTDEADHGSDEDVPAYKDPERLRAVYEAHDSFTEMTEALDVDVTAQTVRRNMMKEGIHVPETRESDEKEADGDAETTDDADDDRSEQATETEAQVAEPSVDGAAEATKDAGTEAGVEDETEATVDEETEAAADDETEPLVDDAPEAPSEDGAGESPPEDVAFSDVDLPNGITPTDVRDAVAESSSLHGVQMALDIEIAEARSLLQELGVLEYVGGRIADRDVDPDPVEIEERIYDSLRARADGSGDAA